MIPAQRLDGCRAADQVTCRPSACSVLCIATAMLPRRPGTMIARSRTSGDASGQGMSERFVETAPALPLILGTDRETGNLPFKPPPG